MKNEEFIASILEEKDDVRWPLKLAATLVVGGQQKSVGEVSFSKSECMLKAEFRPTPGNDPGTVPMNGGILKLKDRVEQLRASHLQRRSAPFQDVFHFYYEVVDALSSVSTTNTL